jgi:hypothetical protein
MRNEQQWSIRIERQPHRDAVRRLRKAYQWLWKMSSSPSSTIESHQAKEPRRP